MSEEILETIIKKAFAEEKTALSFLFQKKAEAGRDRVKARARAKTGATARRNG